MFCSKCGARNDEDSSHCGECGAFMATSPGPQPVSDTGTEVISTIIPYKNPYALIAYYLGIFAFIPCIGAFLGIPAFFLGLHGLKLAAEHPASKGKVHAWIGIIAGGLFGFGNLLLMISFFLIPMLSKGR